MHALLVVLVAASLIVGCGSEPPTPGEIVVTSSPQGADISLDGEPTGEITPATITDLEEGAYQVGIAQTGVQYRPSEQEVSVLYGQRSPVHFETSVGTIEVTSTPAGAAIILDGLATDEVTPHSFTEIDPGDHTVDVAMTNHRNPDGPQTVSVVAGGTSTADLTLTVARIAIYEGFSNVRCSGCPDMINDVATILDDPAYGFDRFVFVKYAGRNPFNGDPFYQSNTAMVNARSIYYGGTDWLNLPTLVTHGVMAESPGFPISVSAMRDDLVAYLAEPIDFYLTVSGEDLDDTAVRDVSCTIELKAPYTEIDLTGHSLRAVLMWEEAETAEDYVPGGDEFHWVARADAEVVADLGVISAGQTITQTLTLNDPNFDPAVLTPHGRQIAVFVQNMNDKTIIQAGSTMYPASN